MIDFRLLGPLEAIVDDRQVELPAGKPSAVLARLLLDAGRPVGAETLVESVWGDQAPPSAAKVLQGYVSQLRKAVGAERIETRPPGYLLRVSRDEYDLGRFEALVESARDAADPARRAELLRRALDLWRGSPLAEFRQEPFATVAARRLASLRVAALEQKAEAELELGRDEAVAAELEAVVQEEPLREQLRRQLIIALYRCGRQADALATYREGRRLLADELGLEPSPELQELERAILRHDPALARPPVRRDEPRGCVVCVGSTSLELVGPLGTEGRELLIVEIASRPSELAARTAALDETRRELAARHIRVRTACFTSSTPGDDVARLAAEQDADLVILADAGEPKMLDALVGSAPCDVAVVARPDLRFDANGPVLVPFGGGSDEWAALELGAWLARVHRLPLHLLGAEARAGRRDASRMLASASLALQRFAGISAEPVIVAPGAEGILGEHGSAIAAALPAAELDATRRALVERATVPIVLVRPGPRPSGLAPEHTLTRFSWSLREAAT